MEFGKKRSVHSWVACQSLLLNLICHGEKCESGTTWPTDLYRPAVQVNQHKQRCRCPGQVWAWQCSTGTDPRGFWSGRWQWGPVLSRIVKTDRIPNIFGFWEMIEYWIPNIFGFWKWSNTEYQIVLFGCYYSNSSNSIRIVPILIRNWKYNIMQKYVSLPIHYGFCTKN